MNILSILQIIVALLIIIAVVIQNRGSDSSMAYGGGATSSYRSKKGLEKFLFYSTIALAAIFAGLSILSVLI